jgi:endonuclease G, mitochondrial
VKINSRGDWRLDGRLKREHQIGNALYFDNALDRGHMVRRRDPGWGPQAKEAESDTFHYTNSAPQHENLNQRDWVGLEDYVLEAAETRGFRVSVLTGPVFTASDRKLKAQPGAEDIAIPEEFWKIAVMVNDATGQLSATGYVLSQGRMIRKLVESPFVFGQYKTYQVRIAFIAAETGLDFSALTPFDPLGADLPIEAAFAKVARVVTGPDSLLLSSQSTG